jgi:hypothetical protein
VDARSAATGREMKARTGREKNVKKKRETRKRKDCGINYGGL